jgi:hypothetical protein
MAVLGANTTLILDALRPVGDEWIVRSAFAVGIFLPVLERSVGGLCPAQRIVALRGIRRSDLVAFGYVIGNVLLLRYRLTANGTVDIAVKR